MLKHFKPVISCTRGGHFLIFLPVVFELHKDEGERLAPLGCCRAAGAPAFPSTASLGIFPSRCWSRFLCQTQSVASVFTVNPDALSPVPFQAFAWVSSPLPRGSVVALLRHMQCSASCQRGASFPLCPLKCMDSIPLSSALGTASGRGCWHLQQAKKLNTSHQECAEQLLGRRQLCCAWGRGTAASSNGRIQCGKCPRSCRGPAVAAWLSPPLAHPSGLIFAPARSLGAAARFPSRHV